MDFLSFVEVQIANYKQCQKKAFETFANDYHLQKFWINAACGFLDRIYKEEEKNEQ